MLGEFRPVPKPVKAERKLKPYMKKRPKKKPKTKKKLELFKGREIPVSKKRSAISKKDYEQAVEAHGAVCVECTNPYVEMHHAKFRSQQGRGRYRNLIPLCKDCHSRAHTEFAFAEKWREWLADRYGPLYWADKYDLFKMGLIPNTTDESFEEFMRVEGEQIDKASH